MNTSPLPTNSVDCYHCGLPVHDADEFTVTLNQKTRHFCCPGCRAIASMIRDNGLDQFYHYRSTVNRRPNQTETSFDVYDRDDIQQSFVEHHLPTKESTAYLLLDDITCAACVWLIEKHLYSITGVITVKVNVSSHHCLLRWNREHTSLSTLMSALAAIGYYARPLTQDQEEKQRIRYQRMALMRLSVAAVAMMQVGMTAIGLYAGALQGIDQQWLSFLRWVSLLTATPVVLFSAQPFWSTAWKQLGQGYLTMEVPISLAIILAYIASAWATITGKGEVYFDSVAMFTFFLLLGRYVEMRARFTNYRHMHHADRLLPLVARRVATDDHNHTETITLEQLQVDDIVRIDAGETVPCDGHIIEGNSFIIEALLTGESEPLAKTTGDPVTAGTINTEGTIFITVTAIANQTRLSAIEQLSLQAQQDKPKIQELANTIARYFVTAVLLIAAGVWIFWYLHKPEAALWITLSVLVVTCPCALSLATPTVLTTTVNKMRAAGLLVLKSHVIETLTTVNHVVLDKTGTLTEGKPMVIDVIILDQSLSKDRVLAIAAALETGSSHPIAHAFTDPTHHYHVTERHLKTGIGVQGTMDIDGQQHRYFLGKPDTLTNTDVTLPTDGQWIVLRRETDIIAWIRLSDALRPSAIPAVAALQDLQIGIDILSGDHRQVVNEVAKQVGNVHYEAGVSPEGKLTYLREKQDQHTVLMVGDGINDVPVLAGADVSVAMDSASDFARTHADAVLLQGDLEVLATGITMAHRCKKIIRQNITWALLYNIVALPLAAAGFVPPYLAAVGMSLSSLIVVFNATRI